MCAWGTSRPKTTTATLLQAIFASIRHLFGEDDHPLQGFVVQVENIIDLFLGDDQRMTFLEGIDVEECQKIFMRR